MRKEIHTLQDLLKYVEEEGERKAWRKRSNGKSFASICCAGARFPGKHLVSTGRNWYGGFYIGSSSFSSLQSL